jgi:starvation-inducible outer membrane lipoprotein
MPWLKLSLAVLLLIVLARPTASSGSVPEVVSLVQLLAAPAEFDGKTVLVTGFLRLEFEGNCLYLHKDDYEHLITKNGVWIVRNEIINAKADTLNMHYVVIAGTFSAKNKGHMSLFSGSLGNITAASLSIKP